MQIFSSYLIFRFGFTVAFDYFLPLFSIVIDIRIRPCSAAPGVHDLDIWALLPFTHTSTNEFRHTKTVDCLNQKGVHTTEAAVFDGRSLGTRTISDNGPCCSMLSQTPGQVDEEQRHATIPRFGRPARSVLNVQ